MKRLIFLFPLIVIFYSGCLDTSQEDIVELNRISKVLDHLENIDKKIRTNQLGDHDLTGMTFRNNSGEMVIPRASVPEEYHAAYGETCLALFSDYMTQLESSSLYETKPEDSRSLKKMVRKQEMLRGNLYNRFMTKLCRLEGEQQQRLFVILSEATPRQQEEFFRIVSDMQLWYYKNIQEINAPTSDTVLTFYTVKVDLGYEQGNKKMQTLMNANKFLMSDLIRNFFSSLTAADMDVEREFYLKARLVLLINKNILPFDGTGKLTGVEDVSIQKLQTFTF